MSRSQSLLAELTWFDGAFRPGIRVDVGDDGRIVAVGPVTSDARPTRRLAGRALLPGFVNAHSHAFQRGLRGRGEAVQSAGAGSFWSWREAMYSLVESLDPERLFELSLAAFAEMRRAGITTVGEFHYLHHPGPARDFAGDEAVIAAASDVGIRLVLLEAYYETGAIEQPLTGSQQRFMVANPAEYWAQMDRLAGRLRADQTLGAVAHSIRAAAPDTIAALWAEARRRDLVLHIHVEEQRREIEASVEAYGSRPMEILLAMGDLDGLTAVHCTHTEPRDLRRFFDAGGRACICPLTEGNLGDGIPALDATPSDHGRLCLGTDSNARISMLEEMRWLEYGQRLATERRGALPDEVGDVARRLLAVATDQGAASLGVASGRIEAGAWADLLAVDLAAPTLAGWDEESLLAALAFGTAEETIAATSVGGRWDRSPG